MESSRRDGAWQRARMNHTSQLRATPLHPMHLRGQHKVHPQALAQTLFYMVGYNTQRMLSWRKATEWGLRAGLWRKQARLMWNTLNDRKVQRLFCVYWQYIQRYPLSGLEIQPFAALQPGCGSWLARDYFAWLSWCMWGRLDYKL